VAIESIASEENSQPERSCVFRRPTGEGCRAFGRAASRRGRIGRRESGGGVAHDVFLKLARRSGSPKDAIHSAFPAAAMNFVQQQRLGMEQLIECEAVGRLDKPPIAPVALVNPPGLARNPNYSQIALVTRRESYSANSDGVRRSGQGCAPRLRAFAQSD